MYGVKTLKLGIPLVHETRINWAFVPLHIAIIYILKLCLDEEIIPRCRFHCSRGYLTKCINWQICPYYGKTLRHRQVYKKESQWLCSTYIEKGVKECKGIRIDDTESQELNITE